MRGNAHTSFKVNYIYFIQAVDGGPIKIGMGENPKLRLADLQVGNPKPLRLIGYMDGGLREEQTLHAEFGHLRLSGEWFSPHDDLIQYIDRVMGKQKEPVSINEAIREEKKPPVRLCYNITEAAKQLSIGERTLWRMVREKEIPIVALGGRRFFRHVDLVRVIEEHLDRTGKPLRPAPKELIAKNRERTGPRKRTA